MVLLQASMLQEEAEERRAACRRGDQRACAGRRLSQKGAGGGLERAWGRAWGGR